MLMRVWEHIFEIATLRIPIYTGYKRRCDFLLKAKNVLGFFITMASDL